MMPVSGKHARGGDGDHVYDDMSLYLRRAGTVERLEHSTHYSALHSAAILNKSCLIMGGGRYVVLLSAGDRSSFLVTHTVYCWL